MEGKKLITDEVGQACAGCGSSHRYTATYYDTMTHTYAVMCTMCVKPYMILPVAGILYRQAAVARQKGA